MIGRLFQTIEKQERDAEVAIFISPRIVPAEAYIPNLESSHMEEIDSASNTNSVIIR
jgi:type II secretory pathway component GspD/PulD (secretin)